MTIPFDQLFEGSDTKEEPASIHVTQGSSDLSASNLCIKKNRVLYFDDSLEFTCKISQ